VEVKVVDQLVDSSLEWTYLWLYWVDLEVED